MKTIERIEHLKRNVAAILSKAINGLSSKSKRRLLLAAGCVVTCVCLFMITTPFHQRGTGFIIPRGNIPRAIIPPEPIMSKEDFEMLLDFKVIMDSLKIYDGKTYTEILQGHQGLLDSVEMLLRLNP